MNCRPASEEGWRSGTTAATHGRRSRLHAVWATLLLAGCHGTHHALAPASVEARHITSLSWTFLIVCLIVFLIVLLALLGAIWRAQRHQATRPVAETILIEPSKQVEHRATVVVGTAVGLSIVTLFGLLLADFFTDRALRPPATTSPLTIKITGHQWWWQLEYDDPTPANIIQTANELHLPLGRPVQLILQSADVIHSFWIPNLQGKKDLIPGKVTTLWLTPDQLGTFRGQCAEFCGHQHAHMGLTAVVESPADFGRWQEAQRRPAPEPSSGQQKRGRDIFVTRSCVLCHTISGTPAGARYGPPLTHVASERRIAAESFPNTRGYLAGWIVDPQSLKPGAKMPPNLLSPDDLQALLEYLESLK